MRASLVFTASERGSQLFVNGILAGSERFVPNLDQFRAGPHRLGTIYSPERDRVEQGHRQIDRFRVWSVVRTEAQIRQGMWETLTGGEVGLLGCWNFEGGDATDLTPAQRHGVLRGNPRFPAVAPPQRADLLQPAQVEGTVKDASGQPLGFATVTLKRPEGQTLHNALTGPSAVSEQFRFAVFNLAPDVFELTAVEGDRSVTRNILLQAGPPLQINLSLADLGTISGTLRMFDGTPHVAVPVQILKATNEVVATVLSDASGRFAFTNVPPAIYLVRCQVLGGYRYLGVDRKINYGEVTAPTGLREARTIRLNPGQSVEKADFTFAPFKKGTWRTYTNADGLPGNEVRSMAEEPNGALWIGTSGGLVRFDGQNFQTFGTDEGLVNIAVKEIAWSREGFLWITTDAGVSQFDGKRFRNFDSRDGLAADTYEGVSIAPNGDAWFSSHYHGLFRYDGSRFQNVRPPADFPIQDWQQLLVGPDNTIWIAANGGLVRYDGNHFSSVTRPADPGTVVTFLPTVARDGTVWFGTSSRGVWRYNPAASEKSDQTFFNLNTTNGLLSDRVRCIGIAPNDVIWFGTGRGVVRFDGKTLVHYTQKDGLGMSDIGLVYRTRDGVLWFGGGFGGGSGLTRFDENDNGLQSFTGADGLIAGPIGASLGARDGSLWLGNGFGGSSGVSRFDGSRFQTFTTKDGLAANDVKTIKQATNGVIWCGTGRGLSAWNGTHWHNPIPIVPAESSARVTALDLSSEGRICYVTWDKRLVLVDPRSEPRLPLRSIEVPAANIPVSVLWEPGGSIWIGYWFGGGLARYNQDGGEWKRVAFFTQENGLNPKASFSLWREKNGTMWVGGAGLSRLTGNQITDFSKNGEAGSDLTWAIFQDKDGLLWLGQQGGVRVFDVVEGMPIRLLPSPATASVVSLK